MRTTSPSSKNFKLHPFSSCTLYNNSDFHLLLFIFFYYYYYYYYSYFFFFTPGRYDPSGDIIVIIEYYCLEDQASSSIAEGKVPRKATRLNLIIIIIIIIIITITITITNTFITQSKHYA